MLFEMFCRYWRPQQVEEVNCILHPQSLQSCPTLCDPMDCSLPGSFVHGIFQVRILEQIAMPSSRGSSRPRDWTQVSCVFCITGSFFTAEPLGKPVCCPQPINPRPVGTRWSLPITSPATNQKNVHEPITPNPSPSFTLSLKTFPWKTLRSWEAPFKH